MLIRLLETTFFEGKLYEVNKRYDVETGVAYALGNSCTILSTESVGSAEVAVEPVETPKEITRIKKEVKMVKAPKKNKMVIEAPKGK